MARCIIVLGVGKCGSSAVAAILDRLGVNMGTQFAQADAQHTYERYEDTELVKIAESILANSDAYKEIPAYVENRARGRQIWGMKVPKLAFVTHLFTPHTGADTRVIVVYREPNAVINSAMRAYGLGRQRAQIWYEDTSRALAARLAEMHGIIPVLSIRYEQIVTDPAGAVSGISRFAFEGMKPPDAAYLKQAAAVVVPNNRMHERGRGWGSVAAGVRVSKHPEAEWLVSWTKMLVHGMMPDDAVLVPEVHMPHHWSANALVRQFLRNTTCDTLHMQDDDMSYDAQALNQLRNNEATWPYDCVMGLCVRRNIIEPSAVLMHSLGTPPMPDALFGDHFTLLQPFKKGEVVEVDAVGLAFTLIRRRVLEAMIDPDWGVDHTEWFKWGHMKEGEDIPFSRWCRENGFRMAIDTSLQIGHVASMPLTWDLLEDRIKERMAKQGTPMPD